VQKEGIRK